MATINEIDILPRLRDVKESSPIEYGGFPKSPECYAMDNALREFERSESKSPHPAGSLPSSDSSGTDSDADDKKKEKKKSRLHATKDAAARGRSEFQEKTPKSQKGSRQSKRDGLIAKSVRETDSKEAGDRDTAREIAEDKKEEVEEEKPAVARIDARGIDDFVYKERVLNKSYPFATVAALGFLVWLTGWWLPLTLLGLVIEYSPHLFVIGYACYMFKGVLYGALISLLRWGLDTRVVDTWTFGEPDRVDDLRDRRSVVGTRAEAKYFEAPVLVTAHHIRTHAYWFFWLRKKDVVCDSHVTISCSLFWHLMSRAFLTLDDKTLTQRLVSASAAIPTINLGPSDHQIIADTLACAIMYARYVKVNKAQVDFQIAPESVESSSTAIDSGRSHLQRFRLRSGELTLPFEIVIDSSVEYLLKPLWGLLCWAVRTPMETRTLYLMSLVVLSSALVVSHPNQVVAFAALLGASWIGGYVSTWYPLVLMSSLVQMIGSTIVTILKQGNVSSANYFAKCVLLLTILCTVMQPLSSASLRTSLTPAISTSEVYMPGLTSSSYVLDHSSPPLNPSFTTIPSSSNTYPSLHELGMFMNGYFEKGLSTFRQIIQHSNPISRENFLKHVSSSYTATLLGITTLQEKLPNTIAELRAGLTDALSRKYTSGSMLVECLEKCAHHWAMDLQTSWSSFSSKRHSDLMTQIASLKAMIASGGSQMSEMMSVEVARDLFQEIESMLDVLEGQVVKRGQGANLQRLYDAMGLNRVVEPPSIYERVCQTFTGFWDLISRSSIILISLGLGFVVWFSIPETMLSCPRL